MTNNKNNDEARLAKNKKIAEAGKITREKRKNQDCRTYHLKIVQNKLSRTQKEALKLVFLEAKWLRNDALANGWDSYNTKTKTVLVKTPQGTEKRKISYLGSQVKQGIINSIREDVKNLSKANKKGYKVGKLKFAKEINSINLQQHDKTYRFAGQKIKLQCIPGRLRVRGLEQLKGLDLANAKLLKKADGYYLAVTTFGEKTPEPEDFKTDSIGLDFGVKTHVTLSDGREFNWMIQESERLRRLQRKLSRQVKGSKNYSKTRSMINREYLKIVRQKNELSNQFVSMILKEARTVYLQDDHLASWKSRKSLARGGKSLQASILGRIKTRLTNSSRVVIVPRFTPTTKTCECGAKTPHSLDKRWFECSACGYTAPRDQHAAQNMIRFGKEQESLSPREPGAVPVEESSDSLELIPVKQETIKTKSKGFSS